MFVSRGIEKDVNQLALRLCSELRGTFSKTEFVSALCEFVFSIYLYRSRSFAVPFQFLSRFHSHCCIFPWHRRPSDPLLAIKSKPVGSFTMCHTQNYCNEVSESLLTVSRFLIASWEVDFGELPSVEGVVGGPSCAPFSRSGKSAAWCDAKSNTFLATLQCILAQAQRETSVLEFFCIENVCGIADRPKDSDQSPAEEVIQYLKEELGTEWAVWLWKVSTLSCGLPQSRRRVFICGRLKRLFKTPFPLRSPSDFVFPMIPLSCLLEEDAPSCEHKLTPNMAANLAWYRNKHCSEPHGAIIVCDLSRAPGKARATHSRVDESPTILTNTVFFVFQVGTDKYRRYLLPREKLKLQGFDPDPILGCMTEGKAAFAAGNAMSLPAIALTIACTLSGRAARCA